MHENIGLVEQLDLNMYIVSVDPPEAQRQLYEAILERYGASIPFISDPELQISELFNMKNGTVSHRGYALLDTDGTPVFHTINDYWGEQFEQSAAEIKEEYNKLN